MFFLKKAVIKKVVAVLLVSSFLLCSFLVTAKNASNPLTGGVTTQRMVLAKTEVLRPFGDLKSQVKYILSIDERYTVNGSVSINSGAKIFGHEINTSVSKSVQKTFTGPSASAKVANSGKNATNGVVIYTLQGTIVRNTFYVYDAMGHKISTITKKAITSAELKTTQVDMNDGGSTVYVTNCNKNNYNTFANYPSFKITLAKDPAKAVFY